MKSRFASLTDDDIEVDMDNISFGMINKYDTFTVEYSKLFNQEKSYSTRNNIIPEEKKPGRLVVSNKSPDHCQLSIIDQKSCAIYINLKCLPIWSTSKNIDLFLNR